VIIDEPVMITDITNAGSCYPSSQPIKSVYGPVKSWRFGRSLGIDPIGSVSTCSFDCIYCQLGKIEQGTLVRRLFVPTEKIAYDLKTWANQDPEAFAPIDRVTLSGNGEPTLALNLADILQVIREIACRPTLVLTNSTLLSDPEVQRALTGADQVVAKLDAPIEEPFRRINRPVVGLDITSIVSGLRSFRKIYHGHLAIQTMILAPWREETLDKYLSILHTLDPDEIQLNVPSRPRMLVPTISARGNEVIVAPEMTQRLTCVGSDVLDNLASQVRQSLHKPVRTYAPRD
jgi:wyosine [tRNA(Phe)-imidazoG37] synthetase (radical SAM superfamily)